MAADLNGCLRRYWPRPGMANATLPWPVDSMSPAVRSRVRYLATSVGRDPVRWTMSPTVEGPSSTAMACKNSKSFPDAVATASITTRSLRRIAAAMARSTVADESELWGFPLPLTGSSHQQNQEGVTPVATAALCTNSGAMMLPAVPNVSLNDASTSRTAAACRSVLSARRRNVATPSFMRSDTAEGSPAKISASR